jgi:hypothetical protein
MEYRKSRRAKEVGDWAEDIVLRYISEHVSGCINCVHRAALDETPGWDIDYLDSNGRLQRVEVKGTVAAAFTGVDITANELRAARTHGSEYWLYLQRRLQHSAVQMPCRDCGASKRPPSRAPTAGLLAAGEFQTVASAR